MCYFSDYLTCVCQFITSTFFFFGFVQSQQFMGFVLNIHLSHANITKSYRICIFVVKKTAKQKQSKLLFVIKVETCLKNDQLTVQQ